MRQTYYHLCLREKKYEHTKCTKAKSQKGAMARLGGQADVCSRLRHTSRNLLSRSGCTMRERANLKPPPAALPLTLHNLHNPSGSCATPPSLSPRPLSIYPMQSTLCDASLILTPALFLILGQKDDSRWCWRKFLYVHIPYNARELACKTHAERF